MRNVPWIVLLLAPLLLFSCLGVYIPAAEEMNRGQQAGTDPNALLLLPKTPAAKPDTSQIPGLEDMTRREQQAVDDAILQLEQSGFVHREDFEKMSRAGARALAYQEKTPEQIQSEVERAFNGEDPDQIAPPPPLEEILEKQREGAESFMALFREDLGRLSTAHLMEQRVKLAVALAVGEMVRLNNDPDDGIPEEVFALSREYLIDARRQVNEEFRARGIEDLRQGDIQ